MRRCTLVMIFFLASLVVAGWAGRASGQALTWWVEPATHKVPQDRPPQGNRQVEIESARNECEPFQVVLRADGGDLVNVHAWISDLASPLGGVIPAENVTFYRAEYVTLTEVSGGSGLGDGVPGDPREPGEYVDPLIPFHDPYHDTHYAVGTPFNIPQNRLQPIIGDVYVPAGTPPGDYEGTVTITVDFAVAAGVPVRLRVWNFTLPLERRVATSYGLSFGKILWYHGGPDGQYDPQALEIIRNYEEMLHRFRIDLTNVIQGPPYLPSPMFQFDAGDNLIPPDYTAFDAHFEDRFSGARYDDGVGAAMINQQLFAPGTAATLESTLTDDEYIQAAADFAAHLKAKGWWDRIYVYVHDEPGLFPGAPEAVAYDVALAEMGDPDWPSRMMATNHWIRTLQFSIGIWCPLTSNYDKWFWTAPEYGREDYQRLIASGDRVWFYVCNGTHPPYAGYDIDTIHGHEPRFLHWQAWYEGATGFLYWSTNYWIQSDPWGTLLDLTTWPTAARTGDGFLLYPGDHDGTTGGGIGSPAWLSIDGPVISCRLMMIRDGMEDWDYLLLAQDLGGRTFARTLMQDIYTQFGMNPTWYDPDSPPWTYDETKVYEARHRLAVFIASGGAVTKNDDDGGNGGGLFGCSVADTSGNGWRGLALMLAAPLLIGLGLRARRRMLFLVMLAAAVAAASGCRGSAGSDGGGAAAIVVTPLNHTFTNATPADAMPGPASGSGPLITAVEMDPGSLLVQGQVLVLKITFTDPENDLSNPSLFLQLRGRPDCFCFGPGQFGGILGGVASVRVEVSGAFEPGAYIIELALMDDAGNVGNYFSALLIVVPYVTPEIVVFVPEDGAAGVPLNAVVRGVFSNPVIGDPPTLDLTRDGVTVPAHLHLLPSMKGITLVPDDFFVPGAAYVAALTVGDMKTGAVREEVHAFTAGTFTPAPDITGRVYSVNIADGTVVEPAGAEIIFTAVPLPPLIVKVTTFDPPTKTIASITAMAAGNPLHQDPSMPVMSFPGSSAVLENPYFKMGPGVLNINLYALTGGLYDITINVYDFSMSGHYNSDGTQLQDAIVTGYIDSDEVNAAVNEVMPSPIPFDACNSIPDACDADGLLAFRAENLTGTWEPQIGDLYDLTVAVNPDAITGSGGGVVDVSGDFLVNDVPSGTHAVNLAADYGTLSCGGASCSVNTAAGHYQAALILPPGRPAGQNVKVTASTSSAIGTINRSAVVRVQ